MGLLLQISPGGDLWRAQSGGEFAVHNSPCNGGRLAEVGVKWVESLLWGDRDCSACYGWEGVC